MFEEFPPLELDRGFNHAMQNHPLRSEPDTVQEIDFSILHIDDPDGGDGAPDPGDDVIVITGKRDEGGIT
ncbi:MAG: hypothetical protein WBA68_05355 [Alteraurantiacibacter sp.]